jgi:hypothetical protein
MRELQTILIKLVTKMTEDVRSMRELQTILIKLVTKMVEIVRYCFQDVSIAA